MINFKPDYIKIAFVITKAIKLYKKLDIYKYIYFAQYIIHKYIKNTKTKI